MRHDVDVHDENGEVVETIGYVYLEVDYDSRTVRYVDVKTGEVKGKSSFSPSLK